MGLWRRVVLELGVTASSMVVAALLADVMRSRGPLLLDARPIAPEEALTVLAALLALALLAWLWLSATLVVLATLPFGAGRWAHRLGIRLAPVVVRRAVAAALGAGLATGSVAASAGAAPPMTTATATVATTVATTTTLTALPRSGPVSPADGTPDPALRPLDPPDPGWVPTTPTHRPQPGSGLLLGAPRPRVEETEVVVRRGDTLWAIASRALGDGATTSEVAAAWPRWYAANREVIGPDPDAIRPGQLLHAPTEFS